MEYKEWIEELYNRADLVKFASKYTALTKKGNTHWGCCPFHSEKTPSFTISEDKQLYHCFSCKAGGNIITFTKAIEHVDYAEALVILAKEFNMPPIPAHKSNSNENYAQLAKKRERLYALMRSAAKHYNFNLSLQKAKPALQYIEKRKLTKNMITRFGLGYSVDSKSVINELTKQGFTLNEMKEAGIVAQRADDWYDVFYGRLIFPIINNLGEVVSFGGRLLDSNPDFAKYRNGSQTVIFDKSKNLYAINLLKKHRQNNGKIDYIIMTEGYMDVIALHSAGFDTAVASMGTALTATQAKLLKNYCSKIYISYDGDSAGQKATLRGLDVLAEAGLDVKVVSLPNGLDPDDVIKQKGVDFYQSLLDNALSLPAFKLKVTATKYDLTVADSKAAYAVEAIKIIKSLKNPVEQEEYLKIVQVQTGYSMASLMRQADITESQTELRHDENVTAHDSVTDKDLVAKRFVLASLLTEKDYVINVDLSDCFEDEFSKAIYEFYRTKSSGSLAPLYSLIGEDKQDELNAIISYNFLDGDNAEKFNECVRLLRITNLENELKRVYEEYDKASDPQLKNELLEKYKKVSANLSRHKSALLEE